MFYIYSKNLSLTLGCVALYPFSMTASPLYLQRVNQAIRGRDTFGDTRSYEDVLSQIDRQIGVRGGNFFVRVFYSLHTRDGTLTAHLGSCYTARAHDVLNLFLFRLFVVLPRAY